MSNLTLTQRLFIEYSIDKSASFSAVAGAGKSYALRSKLIHNSSILNKANTLLLCYNASIAKEWKQHNLNIDIATSHSKAFNFLRNHSKKSIGTIDEHKYSNLGKFFGKPLNAFNHVRQHNLFKDHTRDELINKFEQSLIHFNVDLDTYKPVHLYETWKRGLNLASQTIDFHDMLTLVFEQDLKIPITYDYLVTDETQDFSIHQRHLVNLINPSVLINAYDLNQSINEFNGASATNVTLLNGKHKSHIFRANESKRCPRAIIPHVTEIVQDFTTSKENIMGNVTYLEEIPFDKITQPNTVVIARYNSDLLMLALKCIEKNIPFQFKSPIVESIRKEIAKIATRGITFSQVNTIAQSTLEHLKNIRANDFEIETYQAIVQLTNSKTLFKSVEDLYRSLNTLKSNKTGTLLSTIHSFKGRESANVILLGTTHLKNIAKQSTQEANCLYVALTRTRKNLYLVD